MIGDKSDCMSMRIKVRRKLFPTSPISFLTIGLQVVSAQHLSANRISPTVEVEVYGLPFEYRRHRTKPCQNNGMNPYWPEPETLQCTVCVAAMRKSSCYKVAYWDTMWSHKREIGRVLGRYSEGKEKMRREGRELYKLYWMGAVSCAAFRMYLSFAPTLRHDDAHCFVTPYL